MGYLITAAMAATPATISQIVLSRLRLFIFAFIFLLSAAND
jgi:hypothetical protein